MPIAGLAVTVVREEENDVRKALSAIDGVEVYGSDGKGNLIVVLDCRTEDELKLLERRVSEVDGVVTVSAAYYNFEDLVEAAGSSAEDGQHGSPLRAQ